MKPEDLAGKIRESLKGTIGSVADKQKILKLLREALPASPAPRVEIVEPSEEETIVREIMEEPSTEVRLSVSLNFPFSREYITLELSNGVDDK